MANNEIPVIPEYDSTPFPPTEGDAPFDPFNRKKKKKLQSKNLPDIALISLKGLKGKKRKKAIKHNENAIKQNAKKATVRQTRIEKEFEGVKKKHKELTNEPLDMYEYGPAVRDLMGDKNQQKINKGGYIKKYANGGSVRAARF